MRSAAPDLTESEQRKVLGSFLFSGDDVEKPAGVLSGGEKTRLALALLVVSGANVLLLDEPTNNLDPASREEVLGALRGFRGAIVLVTHDEGAVKRYHRNALSSCPTAWKTHGAKISLILSHLHKQLHQFGASLPHRSYGHDSVM